MANTTVFATLWSRATRGSIVSEDINSWFDAGEPITDVGAGNKLVTAIVVSDLLCLCDDHQGHDGTRIKDVWMHI